MKDFSLYELSLLAYKNNLFFKNKQHKFQFFTPKQQIPHPHRKSKLYLSLKSPNNNLIPNNSCNSLLFKEQQQSIPRSSPVLVRSIDQS